MSMPSGVLGILGPNGAGKTTLMSVLATALKVRPGLAWVGGHDVGTSAGRGAARKLIGWLPQRFDLAGEMTLVDTVAFAAWANGV
ncbi:MAG: ATP-binding cassette domain-containing protein, partial [Mycobacteriaceae bacterium]